jgi:hypothetical protein
MPIPETLIGIAIGLIATSLLNLSPVVMKTALNLMEPIRASRPGHAIKSLLRSRRWLAGFTVAFVGGVFGIVSAQFLGVASLLPLLPFGLIVLVVFSVRVLHEKVGRRDAVGIILLVLIPVFLVLSNIGNITRNITDPLVLPLLVPILIALGACSVAMVLLEHVLPEKVHRWLALAAYVFVLIAGNLLLQTVYSIFKAGGIAPVEDVFRILELMVAGNVIAIVGVITAVGCGVVFLLSTFFQQIANQRGRLTKVFTIGSTMTSLVSISLCLLIFDQPIGNIPFYLAAIACAIAGSYLLSHFQQPMQDPAKETLPDHA